MERILVFSDTHVGSTVGLWPGAHRVEGGGEYLANKYQLWLRDCWTEMLDEVRAFDKPPIVVMNGDPIQGVNYRDGELITNKMDIQVGAAHTLFHPLKQMCKRWYQVRGTEWHEGKASEFVEFLGERLNTEKDPATGQWSWWELYLEVERDGPVIHFGHSVGVSSVPWYEATVPLRDSILQLSELWRMYGKSAPNLRMIVRSHRHRHIYIAAPPDIHVAVTPCWQLKTALGYKKALSMLPHIGYIIIDWDGTDIQVRPRLFELPPLHVEEL